MNRPLRLLVLALAAVAALACSDRGNGAIHASGHIEATEVRLAAKVGGRLLELPHQEGAAVAAGRLVARLDTTDAEHELARAIAEREAADARLRLLLAGSRDEDIRQTREELSRAESEFDAAQRDLDRLEGLASRGTATVQARDDARTRRDVAQRSVRAVRAMHEKVVAGPRPEEIAAARAQRNALDASIAAIRQRIADATVTAPRDGVITQRATEPGEVLPPGALLGVLTDLAHPWLTVYVDEPSLARVRLGEHVTVRVDGRERDFPGTVSFVSPVAEFTPKNVQTPDERAKLVFRVKIDIDNPDGVFKPGMPADAYFSEHGAEDTQRPRTTSSVSLLSLLPSPLSPSSTRRDA
ncbi:MAG: HlyD family efflux transporter periplasmic adaptor subunit [Acidobacteriota bacterium]